MRFSVIIPVYNVEPYLRQCLDSVLAQDYADWEAICVDDGSTDRSGSILDEYAVRDSRLRVLTQLNRGLSAARNAGMDAAKGDYVLFLDSDDWLESHSLSTLADHLDGQPDMLCFNGQRFDESTGTLLQPDSMTATDYPSGMYYYNANALLPRNFPFVCVVLRCYRRQLLTDNNLRFREGILHEDNHFTPRACLAASAVRVIPDVLYNYRVRPGSIMTTRSFRSRRDLLIVANDLAAFFTAQPDIDRSVAFRAITHHYQVPFLGCTCAESRQLRQLIDWHLYRTVSRTRPRHRLNYFLLRFTPTLFRLLNRLHNNEKSSTK